MLNEQSRLIVMDITSMYRMKVSRTKRKFRPTRAHRTSLSDHVSRPLNQSKRTFKANDKETSERACAGVRRTKNEYAGCRSQHFTKIRTQVERRRMGTRIRESRERSDRRAKPATRKQERVSEVDSLGESWEEFLLFFLPLSPMWREVSYGDSGSRWGRTERRDAQRALISSVASRIVIFGVNRGDKSIFAENLASFVRRLETEIILITLVKVILIFTSLCCWRLYHSTWL